MSISDLIRGNDTVYYLADFLPSGVDPTIYDAYLSICSVPVPNSNVITAATNATPIVLTAANHGLTTGDKVAVVNVGGNTGARGYWTVTVINANSFSLNSSVGAAAFTRGGEFYKALPDATGLHFAGSPPIVTVPGSLGLTANTGYLLVVTFASTYRDKVNSLAYVSAIDNSVR